MNECKQLTLLKLKAGKCGGSIEYDNHHEDCTTKRLMVRDIPEQLNEMDTNNQLATFFKAVSDLEVVDFSCPLFTLSDRVVEFITTWCLKLRSLSIAGCDEVCSVENLRHILAIKSLQQLRLHSVNHLSNEDLLKVNVHDVWRWAKERPERSMSYFYDRDEGKLDLTVDEHLNHNHDMWWGDAETKDGQYQEIPYVFDGVNVLVLDGEVDIGGGGGANEVVGEEEVGEM
eukprot:gene27495-34220_t